MQLGGNLQPSNIEEISAISMETLGERNETGLSTHEKLVGGDQQGHEIKVVDSSSSRKMNVPSSGTLSASNATVTQVLMPPEQAVQDLKQSIDETGRLARALEEFLEIAPTMACLRALNLEGLSPESMKLFEANRGRNLGDKKLILNTGEPPVRIPMLIPGKKDEWTSIIPSIIPAGIKVNVPDEHGKWIEMQAPDREPRSAEQNQVKTLIKKALSSYCGSSEGEEKLSEYTEAIKVKDVAIMVEDIDQRSLVASMPELLQKKASPGEGLLLQEMRQHLSSPYVPLLEGLGATAQLIARSAAAVTTTAIETGKGGLEGALYGGVVGAIAGIMPTMVMGSGATLALGASTAANVGTIGGASGGMAASYLKTGSPPKIGNNTSADYVVPGAILGSVIGGGGAVIAAHAGVPAVTAATGAMAGGFIGAINRFPSAVQNSLKYFSLQDTWKKSINAFSRWSSGGSELVQLIQQANTTDEKMKGDLEKFFEPFKQNSEYQKIKEVLIHQIEQRMEERIAIMNQLNRKIKEQNKNAIPMSGPIATKRTAQVRL